MLTSCSCLSFFLLWCPVPVVLWVSLLSPSVFRVLALDGRLADAAAVSLTQILMQMTVYCRLYLSNISTRLPRYLPAQSLLSDPAALRRCACLAWILMHMTVNSVQFSGNHLFLHWHALARRAISAAAVLCPAAPCSLERGFYPCFRGELCPFLRRAAKNDIHPFRNPFRAPPRQPTRQIICIALPLSFRHEN
jgi:hypothetical protein